MREHRPTQRCGLAPLLVALLWALACDASLDPVVGEPRGESCGELPAGGCGTCGDGEAICVAGEVSCVGGEPHLFLRDEDGDGYGVSGDQRERCEPEPPWSALQGGDCDDDATATSPGALERCDGLDNDCDGDTDEAEGMTYSDCAVVFGARAVGCEQARCRYACQPGMRDANDDIARGVQGDGCECSDAEEICDGLDNDCDGDTDEGFVVRTFYKDADLDGWGDREQAVEACAAPPNTTTRRGDCDDRDPDRHPDAEEVCDGVDNDCDEEIDAEECEGECQEDERELLSTCPSVEHARAEECSGGRCRYRCDESWEDRNDDLERGEEGDGCESPR